MNIIDERIGNLGSWEKKETLSVEKQKVFRMERWTEEKKKRGGAKTSWYSMYREQKDKEKSRKDGNKNGNGWIINKKRNEKEGGEEKGRKERKHDEGSRRTLRTMYSFSQQYTLESIVGRQMKRIMAGRGGWAWTVRLTAQ